jgi:hypothetical protein
LFTYSDWSRKDFVRGYCVRITDEGCGVWLWHLESFKLEGVEFLISYFRYAWCKHTTFIDWQTGFSQELLAKIMMGMNEW